ncbi:antibiotic biosynthesis monooxygenase [Micromonospora sp. NBC_01638]|uniref:antibiotic biosynthesis monooxygenase n=1 Tax=Micromonospora sp. NBC_01638 TaxID=2975982 RepID=UPI00387019E6|nr:antibiotic biosynthesis monooxygenase [Micromonospora sp. NBC_01638]
MSVVTITRFKIDPVNAEELRARHAPLVSAIRSAVPGLAEARLGKLDDETWIGIWRWESAESIRMAREVGPDRPEATAAFSLTRDVTVEQAEIVDER